VKNLIEKLAVWLDARSREILSAVIGAMAGIAAMLTAVMTVEPAWCEGRGRGQ